MPSIVHKQNVLTLDQRQQKPSLTGKNSTSHTWQKIINTECKRKDAVMKMYLKRNIFRLFCTMKLGHLFSITISFLRKAVCIHQHSKAQIKENNY